MEIGFSQIVDFNTIVESEVAIDDDVINTIFNTNDQVVLTEDADDPEEFEKLVIEVIRWYLAERRLYISEKHDYIKEKPIHQETGETGK